MHPCASGLFAITLCVSIASAQPEARWMRQPGTSQQDYGRAAASDGSGGVFLAATTNGSLGGPHDGAEDVVLMRYDSGGKQLVLKQFGTGSVDVPTSLLASGKGGVLIAGYTGGDLVGHNAEGADAFLALYDGGGNRAWATMLGTDQADLAFALAPDGEGGVFLAGSTSGTLGALNYGGRDAFLARYDAKGTQIWVAQFGTSVGDEATALASDSEGGVFIAGWTEGSLGAPSFGQRDLFLARYDAGGGQRWITQLGTDAWESAAVLAPAPDGGAFMAGQTAGNLGGAHQGDTDIFVSRFDAAGGMKWIRQIGTSSYEEPSALIPDFEGGVLLSGQSGGSLGGTNEGYNDAVVADYSGSGDQVWIMQFGTESYEAASTLAPDESSGFYVAGYTAGNLGGPQHGNSDIFLARFGAYCYADCDSSGSLDLFDFLCFGNNFDLGGWVYADCDHSDSLDLFDFLCFVNAFNQGCP